MSEYLPIIIAIVIFAIPVIFTAGILVGQLRLLGRRVAKLEDWKKDHEKWAADAEKHLLPKIVHDEFCDLRLKPLYKAMEELKNEQKHLPERVVERLINQGITTK